MAIFSPYFGMQAFWFVKYERDTSAAEDAAESGVLHVSDGLRLESPEDKAMATLLGLAIKARDEYLQQQQQQQPIIRHAVPQEAGKQVPVAWPAGQCLGYGSTSQVWEATVMGGPAAVKMPADPKPYDSEEAIAEGLERLQQEIDVLTGPLRHLQGLAVPRVLAVGTLVDPQVQPSAQTSSSVHVIFKASRMQILRVAESAGAWPYSMSVLDGGSTSVCWVLLHT